MAELLLKRISRGLDRSAFDCGVESLNAFLKTQARQQDKAGTSITVCAVDGKNARTIAGYFTIMPEHITTPPETVLYRMFGPHITGVLLARLATDLRYRGHRVGEFLLMRALERSVEAMHLIGGHGVILDAKEGSADFYLRYGFEIISQKKSQLFIARERAIELLAHLK